MLRLHNTNYDVILFGLLFEITEYARYAYEGKLDEQSNKYSYCDRDAGDADLRVPRDHGQLFLRAGCSLWFMQPSPSSAVRKHHAGTLSGSATSGARARLPAAAIVPL